MIPMYRHFFGETADVVFDVGSRDGDDAEFFREKLGARWVYTIEANPKAAAATRARYPNFHTIETAVSDYTGTTSFLQINSPDKNFVGTSSIDVTKAERERIFDGMTTVIEVPVIRMDELLKRLDLDDVLIDIMKIDVETYTYETLIGLGDSIRDVKMMHLETELQYPREGHRNNLQVAEYMRSCGFWLLEVSYEWGWNIQDQLWINLALAERQPQPPEASEK